MMALAPISATLAGLLLLDELPGRLALLGIAVTLGGVVWVRRASRATGEPRGSHQRIGVAFAVVGAVCQGVGLVLAKAGHGGGGAPLAATWVRMGTATGGDLGCSPPSPAG